MWFNLYKKEIARPHASASLSGKQVTAALARFIQTMSQMCFAQLLEFNYEDEGLLLAISMIKPQGQGETCWRHSLDESS